MEVMNSKEFEQKDVLIGGSGKIRQIHCQR
jgi:hypothetical protein